MNQKQLVQRDANGILQPNIPAGVESFQEITSINPFVQKDFVDVSIKQIPIRAGIEHILNYVKTSPPLGNAASEDEKCLDTNAFKVHTFVSGSWDTGVSIADGESLIFKDSGTDASGDSGTHTKNNKIYFYKNGVLYEFTPFDGCMAPMIRDGSLNIHIFLENTNSWSNLVQPDPPSFSPVQILPADFSGEKEIWNLLADTWLKKAVVVVKTAFDNGAQITLGFDGDEEAICSAYDVDLTTVGVYAIPDIYRQSTADELLKAFLTASSTPTSGLAFIFIEQS